MILCFLVAATIITTPKKDPTRNVWNAHVLVLLQHRGQQEYAFSHRALGFVVVHGTHHANHGGQESSMMCHDGTIDYYV